LDPPAGRLGATRPPPLAAGPGRGPMPATAAGADSSGANASSCGAPGGPSRAVVAAGDGTSWDGIPCELCDGQFSKNDDGAHGNPPPSRRSREHGWGKGRGRRGTLHQPENGWGTPKLLVQLFLKTYLGGRGVVRGTSNLLGLLGVAIELSPPTQPPTLPWGATLAPRDGPGPLRPLARPVSSIPRSRSVSSPHRGRSVPTGCGGPGPGPGETESRFLWSLDPGFWLLLVV